MNKKSGNIAILALIGVIVVGGIAASIYFYNTGSFFGPEKDRVLTTEEAVALLENVIEANSVNTSFHQEANVSITINQSEDASAGSAQEISLGLLGHYSRRLASGLLAQFSPAISDSLDSFSASIDYVGSADVDWRDENNLKGASSVSFTIVADSGDVSYNLTLEGDMVIIDQKFYFRVNKLPSMAMDVLPALQDILGQWYVFDFPSYEELIEEFRAGAVQQIEEALDPQARREKIEKYKTKALELYRENPFFTITRIGQELEMHSATVHQYVYQINKEQLKAYLLTLPEALYELYELEDLEGQGIEKLDPDDLREFESVIDDMLRYLGTIDISHWIDEDTYHMHKQTLDVVASLEVPEYSEDTIPLRVQSTVEHSRFGEDLGITAPENSKDVIEEYKEMGFGPVGSNVSEDNLVISDFDGDGLLYAHEQYYCTDPNNSDTDGDGYSDGSEVADGYNPNGDGTFSDYMASLGPDGCLDWEERYGVVLENKLGDEKIEALAADSFQQDRDSKRMVDLKDLRNALNIYLTTVNPIVLCEANTIYTSARITPPSGWKVGKAVGTQIDGTGWVPVNFNNIGSVGNMTVGVHTINSSSLPIDPVNSVASGLFYAYACSPEEYTYELNMNMESPIYSTAGSNDIESLDFGDNDNIYEVGNDSELDIIPNEIWE